MSDVRALFALEPDITFLNHGSFGACPKVVLDEQLRLRARLEAQPVRFLLRELEMQWDCLIELAKSIDLLPLLKPYVSKHVTTNLLDVCASYLILFT